MQTDKQMQGINWRRTPGDAVYALSKHLEPSWKKKNHQNLRVY